MSTWNQDNDDLNSSSGNLAGQTYHPARSENEWGFGSLGDDEIDDGDNLGQSHSGHRTPSSRPSQPQPQSRQYLHSARTPTTGFLQNLLNPAPTSPPNYHRSDSFARTLPVQSQAQQSSFGNDVGALFDSEDDPTPLTTDSEFVTLEDSSDESDGLEEMPATGRQARRRGSVNAHRTSGRTPAASSSQKSRRRKRSAEDETAGEGRAPQRRRISTEFVEEIDLAKDEAPSAEEEVLKQQQQDAIKLQQGHGESDGAQKIGQRQCIICMENYTNCTATSCGHFYCHECLVQALMTGEKSSDRGIGTCPVCRKPLSRTNKRKMDVIPIQFMKKSQFRENQRKRGLEA